ncbi:MAG: PfkB family carbohydrate kinase [Clostridia bacterium]|nr:PfkB family carbohydrate kinase [Clostridia bacterium]
MSIVVLGAVFVDIKGYPTGRYIPGGRNAGRVEYVHGGVSRNIAEDIGNLELHPVFISLVDDTGTGGDVLSRLNEHNVDTRYIQRVPDGMGTWLAVFNGSSDVEAAISKRPDLTPIAALLDEKGDEIFSQADSVLLEIDMDQNIVKRVFELAARYHKPVCAAVSNMSIALERREFLRYVDCFVCNAQEAGILFSQCYEDRTPEELMKVLADDIAGARIPSMVVTLGGDGAVWADSSGKAGICPAIPVPVADTTGAGDAFFAGVAVGLTYGKSLAASCGIGTRLAASVIRISDNTCPRFMPGEFGIELPVQNG